MPGHNLDADAQHSNVVMVSNSQTYASRPSADNASSICRARRLPETAQLKSSSSRASRLVTAPTEVRVEGATPARQSSKERGALTRVEEPGHGIACVDAMDRLRQQLAHGEQSHLRGVHACKY